MMTAKIFGFPIAFIALAALAFASPATAADEFEKYALESVSVELSSTQAGAHADLTTSFELSEKEGKPYAQTRDIEVQLPPGVIGNPQGIPRCTVEQLGTEPVDSACPMDSQVGISQVTVGGTADGTFTTPVYNMEPPGGDVVARLGLYAGPYPTFINVRVDPIDYSLIATIEGAPSASGLIAAVTTLWGVPAAPSHDLERLTPVEGINNESPPPRKAGLPEAPFMSNPTDCTLQRQVSVTAISYQLPSAPVSKTAPFPQITGCSKLGFAP